MHGTSSGACSHLCINIPLSIRFSKLDALPSTTFVKRQSLCQLHFDFDFHQANGFYIKYNKPTLVKNGLQLSQSKTITSNTKPIHTSYDLVSSNILVQTLLIHTSTNHCDIAWDFVNFSRNHQQGHHILLGAINWVLSSRVKISQPRFQQSINPPNSNR